MTAGATGDMAARIRRTILTGDFAPGQRLVETDLCELYGASRSAVRQALRELVGEGLVEVERNKGARVRVVTTAEAVEITEVRMVVEGLLAAKAAERVTPEQAERLLDLKRAMRERVEAHDPLAYSDLNAELHAPVRSVAAQRTARDIRLRLQAQPVRPQVRLSPQAGPAAASLVQHERIVHAIAARGPAAAEGAMRDHLRDVITQLAKSTAADVLARA